MKSIEVALFELYVFKISSCLKAHKNMLPCNNN